MARSLGRGMAEFRRASNEFTRTLSASLEEPPAAPPAKPAKSASEAKPPVEPAPVPVKHDDD
jgi:Sec-independent protein translocase protein TatA